MNDTTSTTGFFGGRLQRGTRSVGMILTMVTALAATAIGLASPAAAISSNYTYTVGSVAVGTGSQFGVAVDSGTQHAYVTQMDPSSVAVIDTSTNALIDNISVQSRPREIAVDQGVHRAYVTSDVGNAVQVLDTVTNSLIGTIATGSPTQSVAVDQGLHRAYVTTTTGAVDVIDTTTNSIITSIAVGGAGVAVDGSLHRAYVAGSSGSSGAVGVIDTSSDTLIGTILLAPGSYGVATVAVDEGLHRAYVPTTGAVLVIDTEHDTLTGTTIPEPEPYGIGVDQGTHTAYVGNYSLRNGQGVVSVIDTSTNSITNNLDTGGYPYAVAADQGTHAAYVAQNDGEPTTVIQQNVSTPPPAPQAVPYTAVAPCRLFDTRGTTSACLGATPVPVAPVGPNTTLQLKVAGVNGIPENVTAVALNLTGVNATIPTYVSAYPHGTNALSSSLNLTSSAPLANFVTVTVGRGGYIDLTNFAGSADLLADVQGYFAPSTGLPYTPVAPCRLFDTRGTTSACSMAAPVPVATVGTGAPLRVKVAGVGGIPSGVSAVGINLTGVDASSATYVTAYPDNTPQPLASSLNLSDANPAANFQLVTVSPNGYIDLSNFAGTINLLADVQGYTASNSTTLYTATAPCRAFDTRSVPTQACSGAQPVPTNPVGVGGSISVKVAGVNNIPAGVKAVAINLTAVDATGSTYLTAYPHNRLFNMTRGEARRDMTFSLA